MRKRQLVAACLVTVLSSALARAGTVWTVPGDFADVQSAVDGVAEGDTILVGDGVWPVPAGEGLNYGGKDVTVQSLNGPAHTTLDAQGNGRVVTFENGEGPGARLIGFTLTGGFFSDAGSGFGGGGISIVIASPTISHCIVRDNQATWGGGLFIVGGAPRIENTIVSENRARGVFSAGSAITVTASLARIRNCSVTQNWGAGLQSFGGAVLFFDSPGTVIDNSIIWGNRDANGRELNLVTLEGFEQGDPPSVSYSLIGGGFPGTGNIDGDPQFVDWPEDDVHLSVFSPCVNAGDPALLVELDATDIDGHARLIDGTVDMGAEEATGLFLSSPAPGIAGEVNFITVAGTGAGAPVLLAIGATLATTDIPGCPGLSSALDSMDDPDVLVVVLSTFHNGAWFSDPLPLEYAGTTQYLQAIDLDDCKVSNLVAKAFPPAD